MDKFEYNRCAVSFTGVDNKLKEFGEDGWELVSITPLAESYNLVFKRRIEDKYVMQMGDWCCDLGRKGITHFHSTNPTSCQHVFLLGDDEGSRCDRCAGLYSELFPTLKPKTVHNEVPRCQHVFIDPMNGLSSRCNRCDELHSVIFPEPKPKSVVDQIWAEFQCDTAAVAGTYRGRERYRMALAAAVEWINGMADRDWVAVAMNSNRETLGIILEILRGEKTREIPKPGGE